MTRRTGTRERRANEAAEREAAPVPSVTDDAPDVPGTAPTGERAEHFAATTRLRFKDPALLRLALTHRSILAEWVAAGLLETTLQSNERLEFLGDALLGAIVADYLYRAEPDATEGTLTARRVALVRAETLVRWAREIELGDALYLAQGEKVSSGARDRMLAGAFESLVGAIYLDRGLPAARRFVERFLRREAPAIAGPADANPKGHLQELLQERHRRSPAYQIVGVAGPDHARVFTVEVRLDGRLLGLGTGGSKREAEQSAARSALGRIGEGAEGAETAGTAETAPLSLRDPPDPSPDRGRGEDEAAAPAADSRDVSTDEVADDVSPSPDRGRGGRG